MFIVGIVLLFIRYVHKNHEMKWVSHTLASAESVCGGKLKFYIALNKGFFGIALYKLLREFFFIFLIP